jgi:phage tail sheath protein FI
MPVTPTYPGVYVQEVPSGVRTIVGVSTSIGMFIGTAKKGPMFKPVRCVNYSAFVNAFSDDTAAGSLATYVKLFFLNGGTDCYVMRIANGPTQSIVTLKNEANVPVLDLTAKDPGVIGETIRAIVTYSGPQPEATFNLDLFRWEVNSAGQRLRRDAESWKNLSMDPASPLFAADFVTQNSKLVDAAVNALAPPPLAGFSLSGRFVPFASAGNGFLNVWKTLFGNDPSATIQNFEISVDGSPYGKVSLSTITVDNLPATTAGRIKNAIQTQLATQGILGIVVNVSFVAGPPPNGPGFAGLNSTAQLQISSAGTGDVFIRQGASQDLAVPLMLGTAQGGVEVSGHAARRPAPNGITFKASLTTISLPFFAGLGQNQLTAMALEPLVPIPPGVVLNPLPPDKSIVTTNAANDMFVDANPASTNGNSDGVREKFGIIAEKINNLNQSPPPGMSFKWKAEVWGSRLAILPVDDNDNFLSAGFATAPSVPLGATHFTNNVQYYTLGIGGLNTGLQISAPGVAFDGTPPTAADYDNAYLIIDSQVDLFNLMVLPPDAAVAMTNIYGNASVFCQKRRAFLLMDPPSSWTSAQIASTGVAALRVGLVKDFSAIFFPRITVDDNGLKKNVGPAGAIAGLCARTDGTRGVWKAPAGTEADLRGVIGLEQNFSDGENGFLNPRAVNTIRIFPNGIVNWGARTMDGDDGFASEYKYIPIRRLALYMEESLYRGLKWVVFEPNDEPLYAQIRLNIGAFMHNLFRQGAFQGQTPKDAYFVKCDKETTTENDRNLGIVNIWVGFAPLKPAEFVILYLQQMAGQIQV